MEQQLEEQKIQDITLTNNTGLVYRNGKFEQKQLHYVIQKQDIINVIQLLKDNYSENDIKKYIQEFGIHMLNFDLWHHDSTLMQFQSTEQRNNFMNQVVKKFLIAGSDYMIIQQSQIANYYRQDFNGSIPSNQSTVYNNYFFSYSGFNKLQIHKDLHNADFHIKCSSILLNLFKLKSEQLQQIITQQRNIITQQLQFQTEVNENVLQNNRSLPSVHEDDNVDLYILRRKDDNESGQYYLFCCNLKSYKQQLFNRLWQDYKTYQQKFDVILHLRNVCDPQKLVKNIITILKDLHVIRNVYRNKTFTSDSNFILSSMIEYIYEQRLSTQNADIVHLTEQCRHRLIQMQLDDEDDLQQDLEQDI